MNWALANVPTAKTAISVSAAAMRLLNLASVITRVAFLVSVYAGWPCAPGRSRMMQDTINGTECLSQHDLPGLAIG